MAKSVHSNNPGSQPLCALLTSSVSPVEQIERTQLEESVRMQEVEVEDGVLRKKNVFQMHCNLENIMFVLERAFKNLKKLQSKNIILAVGNTGCGKSTMLTSLMYGPESLETIKIDYEITVPSEKGVVKKMKKK